MGGCFSDQNIQLDQDKLTVCPICISNIDAENNFCVTECGHKFCFKCLARSLQYRQTCPMCRFPLVPEVSEVNIDRDYQTGFDEGRQNAIRQFIPIIEQKEKKAYEKGFMDGGSVLIRESKMKSQLAKKEHIIRKLYEQIRQNPNSM